MGRLAGGQRHASSNGGGNDGNGEHVCEVGTGHGEDTRRPVEYTVQDFDEHVGECPGNQ